MDSLEIPWGMTFLPDGDMLIQRKKACFLTKINWIASDKGVPAVRDAGQGGLEHYLHQIF